MTRKQVNLGTFLTVKKFFKANHEQEFSATNIRNELNIDYYSVKLILSHLLADNLVKEKNQRYKWRKTK